ncbi:hypothetical protein [Portibacter lacus]|uniref:Uncharacterized protein n=1 Tax=Portibacter lacus TaxID=1099794 RepID=A0AA37SR75_9BACT|nr:hypothetical protein [Portibacter lacus]GLR18274.1 hypothetical protein GCM10007940_28900 [Portibacter lacus]
MDLSNLNSRQFFLVDGIGAIISASFLGLILSQFESLIGMPRKVLIELAIPACFFAVYSLICYFSNLKNWQPYLKAIAIANILYCILTLTLMIIYSRSLTYLGYLYFIVEIIIVVGLARLEWKKANEK